MEINQVFLTESSIPLNGNDDYGQMSAWYIFSVLEFYPVTHASGIYASGASQFPHMALNFIYNGKKGT